MKKQNRFGKAAAVTAVAAMCAALPVLSVCAAQTLAGDVDKNGAVGVSDVAALQKYLLGIHTLDETAYDNANVYADDTVDVFDLGILKHIVLSAGTVDPPAPSTGDTVVASIVFSENSVALYDVDGAAVEAAEAANVTVSDNTYVTITKSGDYTVSGTSSNGQIRISTDDAAEPEAKVEMSFEDLTLSNATAAPVYVENVGDEVVISAKKGTTSTISDGTSHTDTYTNSEGTVKNISAAIFARDDLKIKGKGTLVVNGNTEDGIVCTNDIKLWNSTLQVNAVDDGVRGDTVKVGDTADAANYETLHVSVTTQTGDGIKADGTDTGKGYVTVSGGTLTIKSYADGIQAEQEFNMTGGTVDIYTYEGSSYGDSGSSGGNWGWGGPGGGQGNTSSTEVSAKGVKAVGLYDEAGTTWQSAGNIHISGGTLTVDSSDDALHCSGTMNLTGGTMRLATADDGLHSDSAVVIGTENGGFDAPYVDITKSYEGVEGMDITVNSGTVLVTSSDDGYNAAGGTDGSGSGGMGGPGGGWGQGGFGSGSQTLTFNGGCIDIGAAGDGLDSNGSLTVNGGYVFVSQTGGGNSPIDCDAAWTYNGGFVIAGGSGDMFNESIPNSYQFISSSGAGINAGDVVTFAKEDGTVLGTMTFANAAAAVVICAPESGAAYNGGTLSGVTYFDSSQKAGCQGTISGGTVMTSNGSGGGGWGQGGMNSRQSVPAGRARRF